MGKIRVLDLAKELNMDSKSLLEKLQKAGIKVSDHMDEVDVTKVKEMFSKEKQEVVEEKRISAKVIRRRKKRLFHAPQKKEFKAPEEERHKEEVKEEEKKEEEKKEEVKEEVKEKKEEEKAEEVKIEEAKEEEVEEEEPKKKKGKELTPRSVYKRIKKEIYEIEDLYDEEEFVTRRRLKKPSKAKKEKEKKKKKEEKKEQEQPVVAPPKGKRKLKIPESITVSELAKAMGIKAAELIKKLISMGVMATVNQSIDFETAALVADEFGYELELDTFKEEDLLEEPEDRPEDLKPRPPVVTVMGHVDHGKTTLLDYIRHSNVAEKEVGGITQHIGAYYVETEEGGIVFIDTPGHEAFTAMRARGAQVTDIIVLVVAADDGVMPQTKEAINHAKAANLPIVVAINKIDKPDANPEMVKRQLAELGLVPEEWGGDTLMALVSAKTGKGVDELLSLILLQAELLELKANPNRPARGTVIESRLDKTKGPVATVIIKNGTLKRGDYFVCGENYGRVRAMIDCQGRNISSAGPSMPVEIYGISGVPNPGDDFIVVKSEKVAKEIVEHRQRKKAQAAPKKAISLEELYSKIKEGEVKELKLIIKTDTHGTLEALENAIKKQSTDEIKISIIHSGIGAITESDVMLASASDAIIIGFNVRTAPRVSEVAEREKVDIRYYKVIYDVIDDIKKAMRGLLEPVYKEKIIGRAEVRQTFKIPKVGIVAGCYVLEGQIERNANVRVLRDNTVVHDGRIASLKRFKDDVKEVAAGYECGVGIENFNDIKPGDILEVYKMIEERPEI